MQRYDLIAKNEECTILDSQLTIDAEASSSSESYNELECDTQSKHINSKLNAKHFE